MKVASVCLGGQLTLICDTLMSNETLIEWNVVFPDYLETRFISSLGNTGSVAPLTVDQTMFQFLRTSVSPLISTMIIDNVTVNMDGTRIDCSYGGRLITSNIINVIGKFRSQFQFT